MLCFLVRIHWEVMFTTFLAIDKIDFPFQDIQTLISNTNFRIAINIDSSNENWFRFSKNPLIQRAWKERIEPYLEEFAEYGYNDFVNILDQSMSETALFTWEPTIL